MVTDIAAGIVLYNPEDEERFKKCLESVLRQFEKVYVYDNSTKTIKFDLFGGVDYMSESQNKGIAYALNRIMERAYDDGYKWVVTIDQDSVLPNKMVECYKEKLDILNLAIVCPQVIDVRRPYMSTKFEPKEEYVQECITSGGCTSVDVWKDVGGFDELLFIDLVDNEFCKRIIVSGYKILRINSLILNQEFGKIKPKSVFVQKFWCSIAKIMHNENFAKFSYKKDVSPMRVYYTNRNILYVNNKLKKYGRVAYNNYNCKSYFGFWISFNIPSIIRGKNKIAIAKAIFNGIKDGKKISKGLIEIW